MTSSNTESGSALITGVSGFAGRHLAAQLLADGVDVTGTTRSGTEVAGVTTAQLDATDLVGLRSLIHATRPDVVYHLAAIVDTVTTPSVEELERVNIDGVATVLDAVAAVDPSVRVIFSSSAFVYGATDPEEQPIVESHPLRPLTPYGETKVAAEELVRERVTAGADVVIARSFQHTGPGHVGAYALPDWAERLAHMAVAGDGGEIATGNLHVERDYLDVRDVTAAYRALAARGEAGEAYNVASGVPVSMQRMLEDLIAAFGVDAVPAVDPRRVRGVDQPLVYANIEKLVSATGWRAAYSRRQTLADLAEFWRARVAG